MTAAAQLRVYSAEEQRRLLINDEETIEVMMAPTEGAQTYGRYTKVTG